MLKNILKVNSCFILKEKNLVNNLNRAIEGEKQRMPHKILGVEKEKKRILNNCHKPI